MKNSIFDFKDYKLYLNWKISQQKSGGHGIKSQIAEIAHCQVSYVSRVLKGNADFSLEQIDAINQLFGHTPDEAKFLFLLLQYCRAGTSSLKKFFQQELGEALELRTNIKTQINVKKTLKAVDQARYYSAWYYAAVHILISIEKYQSKEALAKYLGLTVKKISEVLEFLASIGLAQKHPTQDRYLLGHGQIHLERNSPLISKHHSNWRMRAIQSLERDGTEDLHYSVAVGISLEDREQIKIRIVDFIKETMKIVHSSLQAEGHCLAIDFFKF